MNFLTMDYFITLAEELSFTKAAEKLNITQQTLSAHIANVEKELGCKLFERSVPLRLTYAGEVFLSYVRRFQTEHRSMEQEFLDITGDERGNLRVGISSTRGHIVMPDAIAEFQKLHSGITIDLREGENLELIELLKNDELDMIVAHVPGEQPGLVVEKLYREEVVLLASIELLRKHYGLEAAHVADMVERTGDLAPLANLPFMLVGKRDVPGDIARQVFERSNIRPKVCVKSRNAETLLALAKRGVGACFSPGELVATVCPPGSNAGLRVIHLGKPALYTISAAWKRSDHVWSIILAFYEVLNAQLDDTKWLRSHV